MGWKEIAEGFQYEEHETYATARRVFVEDDSGGSELPGIGDPFPEPYRIGGVEKSVASSLYVRRRVWTCLGGDPRRARVEVLYETKPRDDSVIRIGQGGGTQAASDLPRHMRLSAEVVVASDGGGATWPDTGEQVDQPVYAVIPQMTIHLPRVIKGEGEFMKWLSSAFAMIGKINEKMFLETFPPGTVLFTGAECDEERSPDGDRQWQVTMTFAVRRTRRDEWPEAHGDSDGWNYLFREKDMKFAKTEPPLYGMGDFGELFA